MIDLPRTTIKHVAANEAIGRIAVDGEHNGRHVSVVIEPGEIPDKIKTPRQMQDYLIKRIEDAAQEKA